MKNSKHEGQTLDAALFAQLQPQGGISFAAPHYTLMGDGYCRCLHIYALPSSLRRFWLTKLFSVPSSICSFDVSTKNINEVKKNINRSIGEENARAGASRNYEELYDAQRRRQELQQLYDELSRMGEVLKVCDFRIFVKAPTLAELEERCSELTSNLEAEDFKVTCLLNEQRSEWQSLFSNYHTAHQRPLAMKGLSLTTEQLAIGDPFHHSELLDEEGTLLGFSDTGGAIVFDEFSKSSRRKYYNSIVCGDMGSGKSTLLKKRFKHNASVGNYIRCFDVSGEFRALTLEFGGKIIRCGGGDGMLNPFEILRSGDDEYTSYANHISKLQVFFQCVLPSMDDRLAQELANVLRGYYESFDLTPDDDNVITGLEAEEYPILSDLRQYIAAAIEHVVQQNAQALTEVETQLQVERARNLNLLLGAVDNLCKNYGRLFDGHTSIQDISQERIVTFDISAIKDLGSIFAAEMQILTALCWDNAVNNGTRALQQWENGAKIEEITKFLLLIDESHNWINTRMPLILDMILRYMREDRKYFAGITLASQSVRDYMPQIDVEGVEKIRILFELSQYKFMFRQDSSVKEHLRKVFGEGLTYSQVERIPFLEQGEGVMSIAGDRSLQMKVWLSADYEESLFAGGR